jgi:branched-chain amino acid transport system ATP-binding protein
VAATAAASPSSVLSVESISLSFGGIKALRNVSLDVREGSITSLVGPNGAGKTSLFNAISGFYRPEAGRVLFDGHDITNLPTPQRAKLGLARTFQNIAL